MKQYPNSTLEQVILKFERVDNKYTDLDVYAKSLHRNKQSYINIYKPYYKIVIKNLN